MSIPLISECSLCYVAVGDGKCVNVCWCLQQFYLTRVVWNHSWTTPTEDRRILAIGSAPSNVNVDYVQIRWHLYQRIPTSRQKYSLMIAFWGSSSNQSLDIAALNKWKTLNQTLSHDELNEKRNLFLKCLQALRFRIDTGEQGPQSGLWLYFTRLWRWMWRSKCRKRTNSSFANLDLRAIHAKRVLRSTVKSGDLHYDATNQPYVGSLSAATIERVDIDRV